MKRGEKGKYCEGSEVEETIRQRRRENGDGMGSQGRKGRGGDEQRNNERGDGR